MFPLLETIRIEDGAALHLPWHQKRLDASYIRFYGKPGPFRLEALIEVPSDDQGGLLKCRFIYNSNDYEVEISPYLPKKIQGLKLVYSNSIDYSLKYTNRSELERLLKLRGKCDDVLIIKEGRVTDTSYSNIAFFNGVDWITPARPLLKGTARMRLLEEGRIIEKEIKKEDIYGYQGFKLINAMLDFDNQKAFSCKVIFD